MRAVNRFEFNLLRISQCVVGHTPAEHVLPMLMRPQRRPPCLHRDAVALIQQILGTGIVTRLTQQGAWMRRRHLREGEVAEGSLWQRTPPDQLGLNFTAASLEMLIWITEADASDQMPIWVSEHADSGNEWTVGDRLLQYLVAAALVETPLMSSWYPREPFCSNPLIALAFPDQFASAKASPLIDIEPWMFGGGAWLIEAMQDEFAAWLVRSVRVKSRILDVDEMERIGICEDLSLGGFVQAARKHNRPDLCRFLLRAAGDVLTESSSLRKWMPSLETGNVRLEQRIETLQSGAALLRAVQELARWHRQCQSVGYFDEGYAESQLLKAMWDDAGGDPLAKQANRMIAETAL